MSKFDVMCDQVEDGFVKVLNSTLKYFEDPASLRDKFKTPAGGAFAIALNEIIDWALKNGSNEGELRSIIEVKLSDLPEIEPTSAAHEGKIGDLN